MTTFRRFPASEFSPRRRSLLLGGLGSASAAALAVLGHSGPAAAGQPTRSATELAADFDFDTGNFIRELIGPFHPARDVFAPMDVTLLHRFVHWSVTSWFDATAPYHPTAVGVYSRLGRRPASEAATNRNKTIAALHANYQVVKGVEPGRGPDIPGTDDLGRPEPRRRVGGPDQPGRHRQPGGQGYRRGRRSGTV